MRLWPSVIFMTPTCNIAHIATLKHWLTNVIKSNKASRYSQESSILVHAIEVANVSCLMRSVGKFILPNKRNHRASYLISVPNQLWKKYISWTSHVQSCYSINTPKYKKRLQAHTYNRYYQSDYLLPPVNLSKASFALSTKLPPSLISLASLCWLFWYLS